MEPGSTVRPGDAELERRVEELTARLAAMDRELESFAHSISHDLRAPLRAIDGFSRMLLEDHAGSLDTEGKRLLGVVRENTLKMGLLIEDLLAFSRLNRSEVRPSLLDMTSLARSMYYELTTPEQRAGVAFTVGELPACQGDANMLRLVWMNLISNALKFSSRREHPAVEVDGRREGGETVYCVRDNGVGFDMEYAGKLFKVFQRLHGPRDFEGRGMGLACVQRIIQRHGGRVWAEGAPEAGAVFSFALPKNEV
jgi:light-regulated signal transduction histidine kinase (bacteriophytochrome)